jgi:uncharacterized membrane protein YeaQ/YmgE (transglycosylase-associated protein family)
MEFVWFIVVGLIAGFLAGQITRRRAYGLLGDIVLGIAGALLGGWLFGVLGLGGGDGLLASIVVATIGAIILIVLVRLIRRP